jgi:hypothetical protein
MDFRQITCPFTCMQPLMLYVAGFVKSPKTIARLSPPQDHFTLTEPKTGLSARFLLAVRAGDAGSLGFDPEATDVAAGNEHGRGPRAARRASREAASNPSLSATPL